MAGLVPAIHVLRKFIQINGRGCPRQARAWRLMRSGFTSEAPGAGAAFDRVGLGVRDDRSAILDRSNIDGLRLRRAEAKW